MPGMSRWCSGLRALLLSQPRVRKSMQADAAWAGVSSGARRGKVLASRTVSELGEKEGTCIPLVKSKVDLEIRY